MNNLRAFSEYQQTSALGTSALRQVVALYERILRDLGSALAAFERGDIEKRANEINHVLLVLAELQNALDFEKGGSAAKQLDRFYSVSRAEIVKVSVSPSRDGLQRLIDLFGPVYQAWDKISRDLPAMPVREAAPEIRVKMSAPASSVPGAIEDESQRPVGLWRG